MPELPEVELVVRRLSRTCSGTEIAGGRSLHHKFTRYNRAGSALPPLPLGEIDRVWRHGKWIFFRIKCVDGVRFVRVNLGMSGRFVVWSGGEELPVKKSHVRWFAVLRRQDGTAFRLVYADPRCMGRLDSILPATGTRAALRTTPSQGIDSLGLGVDWLSSFMRQGNTAQKVRRVLSRMDTSIPVKAALMDQSRVAGLGNIYASEACWFGRVHPLTPARDVTHRQWTRIVDAVPAMLQKSIASGGTSLGDANTYRDVDGREGSNLNHLAVYGRAGLPCKRCGSPIVKIVTGSRSTYYCEACQGNVDGKSKKHRDRENTTGRRRTPRSRKRIDGRSAAAKPVRRVRRRAARL